MKILPLFTWAARRRVKERLERMMDNLQTQRRASEKIRHFVTMTGHEPLGLEQLKELAANPPTQGLRASLMVHNEIVFEREEEESVALVLRLNACDANLVRRVLRVVTASEETCERVLNSGVCVRAGNSEVRASLVRIANYIETVEKADLK